MTQATPRKRSPRHHVTVVRETPPLDPAAEYSRLTGRDALVDWLPGVLVAAPLYLENWLDTHLKEVLGDLDFGYRPSLGSAYSTRIAPLPDWVRCGLRHWAVLARSGLISPEKLESGPLPPPEIIDDLVADPPLQLTLSVLMLARGLFIAGRAAVRGDERHDMNELLGKPVLDYLRQGALQHPGSDVELPTSASQVSLEMFIQIAGDVRGMVAKLRRQAAKRRALSGPARDLPARGFHAEIVDRRLPETTEAIHLALLEASAGIAIIHTRADLSQAVRKWCNRIRRFSKMGPIPALAERVPDHPVPATGSSVTATKPAT